MVLLFLVDISAFRELEEGLPSNLAGASLYGSTRVALALVSVCGSRCVTKMVGWELVIVEVDERSCEHME
jgi:hypothetical protein